MFVIFVYVLSVENGTHGVIRFSNLLTAWDASHAAFQAARIESSGNQSASRTHPLRSNPGDLWIQLAHRAEQQDREQHDEQTEQETGYVHKATLLGEFCIDPASRPSRVLIPRTGSTSVKIAAGLLVETACSLKSLRWESFRWTGLGQKTWTRRKTVSPHQLV